MFGRDVPKTKTPIMRIITLGLAATLLLPCKAQYGTFDPAVVKEAAGRTTLVVLDDANTSYNQAITTAAKAEWKFTKEVDFINLRDLGTQPLDPTKNYLLRIHRADKEKHEAVFLALCKGWKQKKDEALVVEGGAVRNMPPAHELASIQIDPKTVDGPGSPILGIYVKHLQNYLKLVQDGKVTDKTTADRIYAGRTKAVKGMTLMIAREHLDKSIPDMAKVKETYTHDAAIENVDVLLKAAVAGNGNACLTDVVLTGEDKTQWCFKRVFNAGSGELMYLRDDAALYGKKQGFISEDLRMIEQSR
jgi:hypothetical protein